MSGQDPSPTSSSPECRMCAGTGKVSLHDGAGKFLRKCDCMTCHGTGKRSDALTKVQGQPDFDLRK